MTKSSQILQLGLIIFINIGRIHNNQVSKNKDNNVKKY